jgi:2,3-diketo-5-methylthio-1-phosphopentane phosphatase
MKIVLLCDFDGTITTIDTCEHILEKLSKDNWRIYDAYLERGDITLEECIQKQMAMLTAPKHQILKMLSNVVSVRPHFKELLNFCKVNRLPFIIVSGGLDFVIAHILKKYAINKGVKVYSGKAQFTKKGIDFKFPQLKDPKSIDFKEDLVNYYKINGFRVFFIGNGLSDYNAVRKADFSFVIKNSKLARLCKEEKLPHQDFSDFKIIIDFLINEKSNSLN